MPSVCRRILVLLVVACLSACWLGGSVSSALAQGAGDQQYQDPFGNSGSGSSNSGSSGSSNSNSNSGSGSLQPLSPSPQTSGSAGTAGAGTGTSASTAAGTTTSSPAATGTLPNTGLDTRVLLLAGGALLLVGLGLRMRNAPERF